MPFRAVMDLTDDAVRAARRAEIAAEFATLPQKYILGMVNDDEETNWKAVMGSMLTIGLNEEGDMPQFGQLAQPSMQPHMDYLRALASRFSGETNVPVSCLGVYADSNPQSYEAMRATMEPLVIEAQNLDDDNGRALRNVALMALATLHGTDHATELAVSRTVDAEFRDPAMPSSVSESDAVSKQVASFPWMVQSDVPLMRLGYRGDALRQLRADRAKAEGNDLFSALLASTPAETPQGAAQAPQTPSNGLIEVDDADES